MEEHIESEKIGKWVHYICLSGIILLIIPSGFNIFYMYITLLLLGTNFISMGLTGYKMKGRKEGLFILITGIIIFIISVFKLVTNI